MSALSLPIKEDFLGERHFQKNRSTIDTERFRTPMEYKNYKKEKEKKRKKEKRKEDQLWGLTAPSRSQRWQTASLCTRLTKHSRSARRPKTVWLSHARPSTLHLAPQPPWLPTGENEPASEGARGRFCVYWDCTTTCSHVHVQRLKNWRNACRMQPCQHWWSEHSSDPSRKTKISGERSLLTGLKVGSKRTGMNAEKLRKCFLHLQALYECSIKVEALLLFVCLFLGLE